MKSRPAARQGTSAASKTALDPAREVREAPEAGGALAFSLDTFDNYDAFNARPEDFVNQKITRSLPGYAPTFYVRELKELSPHERKVVAFINALSWNDAARAEVFGKPGLSNQRVSRLDPDLEVKPGLRGGGSFVEVGAYVLALETGKTAVRLVTCERRAGIDDTNMLVRMLEDSRFPDGPVTTVKFFHTHPAGLHLTIEDAQTTSQTARDPVIQAALAARAPGRPPLPPEAFSIYSTLEGQRLLHQAYAEPQRAAGG
ncbi:MAG: hypothetical protein IPJ65_29135 [Archangiaceae bacterium]|nr:hypothetical protein [Archangiaceae bacterium]